MKKRKRVFVYFMIFVLMLDLTVAYYSRDILCEAAVKTVDFEELKEALEDKVTEEIYLEQDIEIEDMIEVTGKKTLYGNGHTLKRMIRGEAVYGGTFFEVKGADFSLEKITVYGGGISDVIQENLYGRLMDIASGKVVLGSEAVLCANKNVNQNNDGGGAVRIKSGGVFELNGGAIKENQNVTKGAGVCVEKGGRFIMKSGVMQGNKTMGIGAVQGFDGRGGAIYSQGYVEIRGGKIIGNRAMGYIEDGIMYGGAGGAIYAGKASELLITGGTISGNEAGTGPDIYQVGKGESAVSSQDRKKQTSKKQTSKKQTSEKQTSKKQTSKKQASEKQASEKQTSKKQTSKKQASEKQTSKKQTSEKQTSEKQTSNKQISEEQTSKKKYIKKQVEISAVTKKILPAIKVVPRWFFKDEIEGFTEEEWRRELLRECQIHYGDYKEEEVSVKWSWDNLLSNKTGSYCVRLTLLGKISEEIPVHIVADRVESSEINEKIRNVRFYPEDRNTDLSKTVKVVWHFEAEDILKIKQYMKNVSDPFSKETNDGFLTLFSECRREGEFVGECK